MPSAFHERSSAHSSDEGIHLLRWKELDDDEQQQMTKLFNERVWPVLTPLAVDPAHPFPLHLRALAQPRGAAVQP